MLCYYSLCLFLKTSFKIFHIYRKQIGNKFPDRVSLEETDIEYRRIVVFIDTESIILLLFFFFFFFFEHYKKCFKKRKTILACRLRENRLPARCGPWGRNQPTPIVMFPVMKSAMKSHKAE